MRLTAILAFTVITNICMAQEHPTGGDCGRVFTTSIVYDHNPGVPVAAPFILYKDSSYTGIFHFEGTGRAWTDGGGSIVASFDTAHSTPITFTGFGWFSTPIPIKGFDTGRHTISLSLITTDMDCAGSMGGQTYNVYVTVDTSKPPVPPIVPTYQPAHHYTDAEMMPYPNPTSDSLHFILDSAEIYWQLDIYSLAGNKPLAHFRGYTNHVAVPIGELTPGIYCISLTTNQRRLKTRFQKEN
jgi:hypothetical protein